jgi:hypothetical protein
VKRVYLDALIDSYLTVMARLDEHSDDWLTARSEVDRLRKLQTDAGHLDYYQRRAA